MVIGLSNQHFFDRLRVCSMCGFILVFRVNDHPVEWHGKWITTGSHCKSNLFHLPWGNDFSFPSLLPVIEPISRSRNCLRIPTLFV